jgi:hypothetical protein
VFVDLHLHSIFSDGTYTPEEIVHEAQRCGLRAIALTDHDTLEGCPRAAAAAEKAGIEFIPGTELTAEIEDNELHLLGYYVDPQDEALRTQMRNFQRVRQERIREMVARINALGIPLQTDAVFALASCHSPGRPHVARALVDGEFCADLDEAFARFLRKGKPAFVPKMKITAQDAIELIHHAGGLAVLAHPGINNSIEFIPALADAGIDGIECFHTKHSTGMSRHFIETADRFGLLVTGGSDCHGLSKGKPLIGTVRVPYECVERLRNELFKRAAEGGFLLASKHPEAS